MDEIHKISEDGLLEDGVSTYPADTHDLQSYLDARRQLNELSAPQLILDNRRDRLFVAAFDGTGNDAIHDPEHTTNVALLTKQIDRLRLAGDDSIMAGYEGGVGTHGNVVERWVDLATGQSYDARLEAMYERFCKQAQIWLRDNPDAQIRVADIGFSRGAEQAAGFARLVHERGIMDPDSRKVSVDDQGRPRIEYGRNLVAPGTVAQAVGLIDPVGTGEPRRHDRRLPPSVISGFQITAEYERRGLFKSTHIIDPGTTPDGRFLNVTVGGAHSDVGGSYHLNGLSIRAGNLLVGYLNGLMDPPRLGYTPEPQDARLNVVHRSEEGNLLYRVWPKVNRMQPGGYVERLVPDAMAKGQDVFTNQPVDETLAAQFRFRRVNMPAPAQAASPPTDLHPSDNKHPYHVAYGGIRNGVAALDAQLGKGWDQQSENLTAGLTLEFARQHAGHGMTRVDHLMLSERNGVRGESAILIQGDLRDPTHRRMVLSAQSLVNAPSVDSYQALGRIAGAQAASQAFFVQAQAAPVVAPEELQLQAPRHTR